MNIDLHRHLLLARAWSFHVISILAAHGLIRPYLISLTSKTTTPPLTVLQSSDRKRQQIARNAIFSELV